jgi:extracellular elastinolytic metalloproteinase
MKKITLLTAFLISFIGFSQANKQLIQNYLDTNKSKFGLTSQDISEWTIENEFLGQGTKITSTYIVQRHQGIEVFNAQSNVSIKDGNVLKLGNNFQSNVAQKVNTTTPSLNMFQAIKNAYSNVGITSVHTFVVAETINDKKFLLSDGLEQDQITAKLGYCQVANKLKLAWAFQFYAPGNHYWDIKVDANNGTVLEKNDLTISCNFGNKKHSHSADSHSKTKSFSFQDVLFNSNSNSLVATPAAYRVIPYNYSSPNHSAFQLISTTGNSLASPNGWHNSNTLTGTTAGLIFNYTRGNNVWAQEDANGNNGSTTTNTIGDNTSGTLTFDFPYLGQNALPTAYTNAATTNLFYMTNIMHDVWYQYGFDEANGNFQQNNYGRGGTVSTTGDTVFGDSQDGYSQTTPTLNNANFTPTNDGVRPRIQMFLWDAGAPPTDYIQINSPASIAGPMSATTNVFEGTDRIPVPAAPNGISSQIIHYNNAPNPNTNPISTHNACVAPTNAFDISGKIALIRRGNCNFSNKVKNAQDAGALAAIVYDTVVNNPTRLSMSSTGLLGITIPAIFISREKAESLLAEMANGPVNIKIEVPSNLYLYADGDFDNTIIGHEYGHGISNRLVGGGLAGCMTNQEQMGEGWSDFFGLMMQLKTGDTGADPRTVGTFAINEPNNGAGIRDFPYSTDMTINPRTFSSSNWPYDATDTTYRYKIGEFWASVLWDLNWAYINQYGFDPDIYNGTGGNNKVMRLVLDALKLDTCNGANMITGRDNIFAADQATTGGANYNMIAEVFRRRGLGLNASSGLPTDSTDQVEGFTAFPLANTQFNKSENIRIYPNPSNGLLNVRINQFVGKVTIQILDINGRVVFNQTDDKFNIEKSINLNKLQTGVYVVKINTNEFTYSEKLIRN